MMEDECVKAYMCKTDWEHHVPDDDRGCHIYFTKEDAIGERKCIKGCGLVELEIKYVKTILEGSSDG